MTVQLTPKMDRSERTEYVSSQLLPRAGQLTRLLVRQICGELSRSELGLLNTVREGPRRITELADLEGLAQPTMTLLVQRLEERGFVERERHLDDGRVVLVRLTEDGKAALDAFTSHASATLRKYLSEMPDDEIATLAAATEALGTLAAALQGGPAA